MKIGEINKQIKDAVRLINDTLLRDIVWSTVDSFSVTPEGLTIGEDIDHLELGKNTKSGMDSGKIVFNMVFGELDEDGDMETPEYEVEITVQLRADVTVGKLKEIGV